MSNKSPLAELLADLQDPRVIWQLAAIAGALLVAWLINRFIQGRLPKESGVRRVFGRIGTPVIAMALLFLARLPVAQMSSIGVIRAAILLLMTFAALDRLRAATRIHQRSGLAGEV
jgi:small-conductance mechanosensitive channel